MDVKTIRRQNLALLKRQFETFAALERATGGEVTASYLSQVNIDSRDMGDKVARRLEEKLGLEFGWMDRHHSGVNVSEALRSRSLTRHEQHSAHEPGQYLVPSLEGEDGDVCAISQLDVRASMGFGAPRPGHDAVIGQMRVSREWVRRNLPDITNPENLRLITGYGDSMEPTFYDGSILFVDVGVREARVDAVYVFNFEDELYIKTLQRLPGNAIRVISDNRAKYDPFVVDEKSRGRMEILARVVGRWNWSRL